MRRRTDPIEKLLNVCAIAGALAFLLAAFWPSPALPHQAPSGWTYPEDCCSNRDCAPASVTPIPGSTNMLVSTRFGQVEVPRTHPYVLSPDAEPHACIQKGGFGGPDKLICLFLPGGA